MGRVFAAEGSFPVADRWGCDAGIYWTAVALLRMLGNMRNPWTKRVRLAVVLGTAYASARLPAQTCTTQAHMTAQQRTVTGSAAYDLASAVLAGDTARVRSATVAKYAADFEPTANLVRATSNQIAGDTLAVTQMYLLDAAGRAGADSSEADFACPLAGTVSETDFGIPGLPQGQFAFAMVEARGAHPWLLSFLLQQEGGSWKMAGFYPHGRDAAGHDGLWYWTTARADVKADKPWLAWMLYQEADQLLRPAPFVNTGNLDKLKTEQRNAAPSPLSAGLTQTAPLVLQGANGSQFRVTELQPQRGTDGKELNLVMHLETDAMGASTDAARTNAVAAMTALLTAHPELRQGFTNVWVVAAGPTANVLAQEPVEQIGTVTR